MTDITDTLHGYSRALYANWLWHRGLHLIVDAGEGLTLGLASQVFSADLVAITHGHSDHVLGLPGFAAARRFGKGATAKPWTVVAPAGSPGVAATRELIARLWPGVAFPITWIDVRAGERVPLTKQRTLHTFAVTHNAVEPSVGYVVREARRRLKPEYIAWSAADIEQHVRKAGRDSVMDTVAHPLFAHTGDAMPIDPSIVEHADLLVHDATFLGASERREPIHATSDEVFAVARDARVATLLLHHLSVRYDRSTAIPTLRAQAAASGFTGRCWLLDDGVFVAIVT